MDHACAVCGESDQLLRDCKYCTAVYCGKHALPENHNCPGLDKIEDEEEWFRESETGIPTYRGEEVRPRPEPIDNEEITTYGSADPQFDSSPDVAPDGSIVRDEPDDDGETTHGVLKRLVSSLKFWT